MPVCGPKLSVCVMSLSIWGAIQLGLTGVFYYVHAVALSDDLAATFDEDEDTLESFYKKVDDAYDQQALNCWIAAAAYVCCLLISAQQFWANQRTSKV